MSLISEALRKTRATPGSNLPVRSTVVDQDDSDLPGSLILRQQVSMDHPAPFGRIFAGIIGVAVISLIGSVSMLTISRVQGTAPSTLDARYQMMLDTPILPSATQPAVPVPPVPPVLSDDPAPSKPPATPPQSAEDNPDTLAPTAADAGQAESSDPKPADPSESEWVLVQAGIASGLGRTPPSAGAGVLLPPTTNPGPPMVPTPTSPPATPESNADAPTASGPADATQSDAEPKAGQAPDQPAHQPADPPAAPAAQPIPFPEPTAPLVPGRTYRQVLSVTDAPQLRLDGITWSLYARGAIINQTMLELGGELDDVYVIAIEPKRVLLRHQNREFYLAMP